MTDGLFSPFYQYRTCPLVSFVSFDYTSFGQPLSTLPASFQFGYTGCYFDTATGLQWNVNRWYNPSIQRWMSQDPLGLGPDANPYRYCGNGPTDGIDPAGLMWIQTKPGYWVWVQQDNKGATGWYYYSNGWYYYCLVHRFLL